LKRINRGHDVSCFERTVLATHQCGINVCAHVILGLPGENREMMLQTAQFLSRLPVHAVKIHLLYVVKNTPMAELYEKGQYRCLEQDEYVDLVVEFLENLPPEMVVQRLTGDPIESELLAPGWAKEKSRNIQLIQKKFELRNTWQGRLYKKPGAGQRSGPN
jgi:radical SAM protein (TIGR01212 family)